MTEQAVSVVAPASYGQERIWLAAQLAPEASYHVCGWTLFADAIGLDRVRGALDLLAARHESLRTRLELRDDRLVQVVLKEVDIDLGLREPLDRTREQVMLGSGGLLTELTSAPFDPEHAPWWRSTLLRCSDGDLLLTVAQHAIFDAASQEIFSTELSQILAGGEEDLPDVGLQPADVATWQRGHAEARELDIGLAYWSRALTGAPPIHELPLDGRRSEGSGQPGDDLFFRLPDGTSRAAATLGSQLGASEFMVAFAGFAVFLHRVTGQDEIVVGVPVSDRDVADAHRAIGMFVNTVVLRVVLTGDPTFGEVVQQVRERMLEAWDHAYVPLQLLVERMEFERIPGAQPLYQIGFNHLGGSGLGRALGHAKDELFVELSEDDGRVEFRTDLLTEGTARRLAETYGRVLAEGSADPARRISQIDLVGDTSPVESSGPPRTLPAETVVDRLGELARYGDRAAVRCGAERLGYDELDGWSARIAADLRRRGCRRGDVIALESGRSLGLVPAVVGILRAGCAYLPLDPDLPAVRHERMIALAGARIVLRPDEVAALRTAPDSALDAPAVGPDDAAYVIFTSGSTGEPKGVVNTVRGLTNRLDWMQRVYGIGTDDVVLHKTPTSFDVSVWELLWSLMHGAAIAIAPPLAHRDPAEIAQYCRDTDVTVLHFVPSMLAAFHAAGAVLPPCVRQVVCSGEALSGRLVRDVLARHPGLEIDNLYGPAEAAIDVTRYRCTGQVAEDVPLGAPLDNVTLRVLDAYLRPVPVGIEGDLHIAGAQVARGYLRRPGLTASRFVPDPYGPAGTVMYVTGDRARWNDDGTLSFRGRRDDQVKIRGQRVELGEITALLRGVDGVRDAATIVASGPAGNQWPAAFFVGDVDASVLSEHAERALPDVMVPRTITRLPALPVTTSGKLDRARLVERSEPVVGAATPAAPSSATEGLVLEIFQEMLGPHVGLQNDFFAAGGNSLIAVRALTRVRAKSGLELPVSTLFDNPTAMALARALERAVEAEIASMSDDQVVAALGGEAT